MWVFTPSPLKSVMDCSATLAFLWHETNSFGVTLSVLCGLLHDVFQLVSVHPHPHWNLLHIAQRGDAYIFYDMRLTLLVSLGAYHLEIPNRSTTSTCDSWWVLSFFLFSIFFLFFVSVPHVRVSTDFLVWFLADGMCHLSTCPHLWAAFKSFLFFPVHLKISIHVAHVHCSR